MAQPGLPRSLFAAAICLCAFGGCTPSCSCATPLKTPASVNEPSATVTTSPPEQLGPLQTDRAAPPAATTAPEPPQLATGAPLELPLNAAGPVEPPASVSTPVEGATGTAAPTIAQPTASAPSTVADVFPDFAKAANKARLRGVSERLASSTGSARLALSPPAKLGSLLPRSITTLDAGPIIVGPTLAGDQAISVVARLYRNGERQIYIKVSDTAQASFMRGQVLDALEKVGGPNEGFEHGRFVDGHPAVLRYYPVNKSSQLIALVDGRYVVEVRVSDANGPYEAQDIFRSLSLSALTKR